MGGRISVYICKRWTCLSCMWSQIGLVSQQTMFKKAISQSEDAVKASFSVAAEITKSDRAFVKEFVNHHRHVRYSESF